jgi:hypothetical protein
MDRNRFEITAVVFKVSKCNWIHTLNINQCNRLGYNQKMPLPYSSLLQRYPIDQLVPQIGENHAHQALDVQIRGFSFWICPYT